MKHKKIIEKIKNGKIFVYPTDTVYGLGCDANNIKAVEKLKKIKGRDGKKPLSIIAPSKSWILENLITTKERLDKYLPGNYTLILRKKDSKFLTHASNTDTLGVRIPKHEFTEIIKKAGAPFITTSANLTGEKPASEFSEITERVIKKADILINGGKLSGIPSTIILEDGSEIKR